MDREKIINYIIKGDIPRDEESRNLLHGIIRTFPYFQTAQVLYAKQLYDDNDTEVAARIKLASAYSPNRKAMYLLFKRAPILTSTVSTPTVTGKIEKVEKQKENSPLTETFLEKEIKPTPVSASPDLNSKHSFEEWLKVIQGAILTPYTLPLTLTKADIIERFLTREPRISKPKTEFFSPARAAKMSISDEGAPVSETLAEIFISQGNFSKALQAYQNLLALYPEKNSIFAARIKEIEHKIELQKNK